MNKRSSSLCLLLAGLTVALAGCASSPPESEGPTADPVRETQNPEAPPYGKPRPKIRPKDVISPDNEE